MTPSSAKCLEVDNRVPIFLTIKNDRDWLHTASLTQAERIEQFIQGAISAREDYQRRGS